MGSRYERRLRWRLLAAAIIAAALIVASASTSAAPVAEDSDRDCSDGYAACQKRANRVVATF